ncbi:MAG: phosphatase PAP2 family protein [Bacteroidales bacterium]|nr:phosphatase PAP2 family protein [Bacteroidales bacterium]
MRFIFTILILLYVGASSAQNFNSKDSLFSNKKEYQFSYKRLILPVSLMAVGAIAYNCPEGKPNTFNRPARYLFYEKMSGSHVHFDDVFQYAPAVAYLCIGGKEKFTDRLLKTATAGIICWAIVTPIKETAGERRPDMSATNSFPSGHTATAFMGAELIRLTHGKALSIPAYLAAATVGCFRIHNNRHWFNDLVAGAGIGILSARISHWLLPIEKRVFSKKDKKSSIKEF